jgi:hypothetical protein
MIYFCLWVSKILSAHGGIFTTVTLVYILNSFIFVFKEELCWRVRSEQFDQLLIVQAGFDELGPKNKEIKMFLA